MVCNEKKNVFVKHRSDIDHQRQDHRSLQARRLRTSPHTGLTLAPYRAFLHESGSYPLDGREDEIRHFLNLGVSKSSIAKITGVTRPTLYNFIATRGLKAGA